MNLAAGTIIPIFWFLPAHGHSHYLGTSPGTRTVSHRYLQQLAQAADELGQEGVRSTTGRSHKHSWVVASSLMPLTERLKFSLAIRPGTSSPTVAARQAATLDRFSNGQRRISVVTGGDASFLTHDERDQLTMNFCAAGAPCRPV